MPKLEFFVVSDSMAVDQSTNKVSILEILENVSFQENALNQISRCVAFSLWKMEPEDQGKDFQVLLRIHLPWEKSPRDSTVNFTATSVRQRVFTWVRGIPLQHPGELRFEVLLNGHHAAEHLISVVKEG